ncbi:hypothetical protein [Flavobacterium aquiphilum]|uniref:hypothetical protein n=1 Tax=Flavobacterium aquiphilum TaxID=3003261 RepID=UPI0024813A84|nr:hypothetical protein [Flavobacterium aquiphilum]
MMYASLAQFMGENGKETDIMVFPWEEKKIKKLAEEEMKQMQEAQAISEAFFARVDAWRAEKAKA